MITKGTLFFCCLSMVFSMPQFSEKLNNIWKAEKPGELLRSLDAITSSDYQLIQPSKWLIENVASYSQSRLKRKTKNDDDSYESLEERSKYDYEKAYEEFVKKYFNDAVTDALSASDSIENAEYKNQETDTISHEKEVESYEEQEPLGEASIKTNKAQKCKNVRRGQQSCMICKNARNGETSENCSYNKATTPQSYKFEKQKNYHKYYTPAPDSSDEEESMERVPAARRIAVKQTNTNSADNSICTIKKTKEKICYRCENAKGEKDIKCFAKEIPRNSYSKKLIEQNRKKQKSRLNV